MSNFDGNWRYLVQKLTTFRKPNYDRPPGRQEDFRNNPQKRDWQPPQRNGFDDKDSPKGRKPYDTFEESGQGQFYQNRPNFDRPNNFRQEQFQRFPRDQPYQNERNYPPEDLSRGPDYRREGFSPRGFNQNMRGGFRGRGNFVQRGRGGFQPQGNNVRGGFQQRGNFQHRGDRGGGFRGGMQNRDRYQFQGSPKREEVERRFEPEFQPFDVQLEIPDPKKRRVEEEEEGDQGDNSQTGYVQSEEINQSESSNLTDQSEQKSPEMMKKEDLLAAIEKIEIEITKYEDHIELLEKNRQAHFLDLQQKSEQVSAKRHKILDPILTQNQQVGKDSEKEFDHLLYKCSLSDPQTITQPTTMDCWKNNVTIHETLKTHLAESIIQEVNDEYQRLKPIAEKYKKLKKYWAGHFNDFRPTPANRFMKTLAKCPDMLSETNRDFHFLSTNSMVLDPVGEAKQDRMIEQAWSSEDRKTFIKKYALFPKDFKRIQSFLPHKTYGECVTFYYSNKMRLKEFHDVIKNVKNSKKYVKRIYEEGPVAKPTNPDVIELTPREIRALGLTPSQAKEMGYLQVSTPTKTPVYDVKPLYDEKPSSKKEQDERLRWTEEEKSKYMELFQIHGRNFAEIAKQIQVKNEAQCKNFYNNYKKRLNLDTMIEKKKPSINAGMNGPKKPSLTTSSTPQTVLFPSEEVDAIDDPDKKKKRQISYWTKEEKDMFVTMYNQHGRDWKQIADVIGTKSQNQVKNFFQNYKVKLGLAPIGDGKKRDEEDVGEDDKKNIGPVPMFSIPPNIMQQRGKTLLPQQVPNVNKPRIAPILPQGDQRDMNALLQMMHQNIKREEEEDKIHIDTRKSEEESEEQITPDTPEEKDQALDLIKEDEKPQVHVMKNE